MKMNIRQIFLGARLLVRLCLPATVFIGLCIGIFIAFISFLSTFSQTYPSIVGGSWLSLLIFYIIFGVAFIRFNAHLIHSSFGSEELRVQRRMVILSGFPFYALCLFLLTTSIVIILDPDVQSIEMIGAVLAFSLAGFIGFALTSCSYVLLTRFFLGRSTAIAHQ